MTPPRPSTTHASPPPAACDGAAPVEPDRSRIAVDLVEDGGDWSGFGDIETLVRTAAHAVAEEPAVARRLPDGYCEAVVVLSADADVARLNGQYRAKPKPTNVLSFPAPRGTPAASVADAVALGDVVLADGVVRAEAADGGVPLAHHLQHLVVHGLLHLAGYDHLTAAEADEMEALETAILARLGVSDPYAGSDPVEA